MKPISYRKYTPLLSRFSSEVESAMGKNLISIILYGSVARGGGRAESDVDLLVILEKAPFVYWQRLQPFLPILRRLRKEFSQEKTMRLEKECLPLSVVVLTRSEADDNRYFYLDMIEDAKIFIDRDHFFKKRLEGLKARLKQLGARKVRKDPNWYWDLKPDFIPGETVTL